MKLAELASAGAEVLVGDTSDAAFLASAFRGAGAVYTLLPTDRQANFYEAFDLIRHQGITGDSVASGLEIPMIATRDIAAVAAQALAARDWNGVVIRELLGLRDFGYDEATRILGERIGRPDLQYVQFSYEDMAQALVDAGLSESFAQLYVEMTRRWAA
jgi:uncharacterized protein YbjT (DUF2867 family)